MALRTTMQAIISDLRQFGAAATDDEFNGVTYWTDAQLQEIADRNGRRGTIKMKRVDPDYMVYRLVAPQSITMENAIVVYTTSEAVNPAPFSFNPLTAEVTFETAQSDEEYLAYGFVVQLYDALADLWQTKADQRFNYIDWKAQNNKMNMKQEYDHCVERAMYYRGKRIRSFDRKGRGKWHF